MARILDRSRKGSQVGGHKVAPLTFDSSGVSAETSDVSDVLFEYAEAVEIGTPELHQYAETTDGTTAEILTVPAGTAWRLVGLVHQQTNAVQTANRIVTVSMRTVANADIEVLSSAVSTSGAETEYSFLFGSAFRVGGTAGVKAVGTLVIPNQITATDTMTINGQVLTFVAVGALTAESQIELGSNLAATKVNMNKAIGSTPTVGNHSVTDVIRTAMGVTAVDFSTNDMVFTAVDEGTYEILTAETFTHTDNVFGAGALASGVDHANVISALDYPEDSGPLLTAGEDVEILVTAAHADDDFKGYLFVIALTQDPTT